MLVCFLYFLSAHSFKFLNSTNITFCALHYNFFSLLKCHWPLIFLGATKVSFLENYLLFLYSLKWWLFPLDVAQKPTSDIFDFSVFFKGQCFFLKFELVENTIHASLVSLSKKCDERIFFFVQQNIYDNTFFFFDFDTHLKKFLDFFFITYYFITINSIFIEVVNFRVCDLHGKSIRYFVTRQLILFYWRGEF